MSAAAAPPATRRATEDDVGELAQMLTRAFLDDPVVAWAFKPPHDRRSALERFQATRLRQVLDGGEVWTTADLSCAALWAAPGHWRPGAREEAEVARCYLTPRLIVRLPLAALGWQLLERRHPGRPEHWYLAVLGTDPSAQGQGLGSAVLAQMLSQCDEDGVAAYLESSKRRNIDFYARHGFRVTSEYRLLRGPLVWPMWRDPRP